MGSIGQLEEYIVRIEDSATALSVRPAFSAGDAFALHEVPWASVRWTRVLNDISTASVTVPNDIWGRTLCPYPLHGWDQTLAVYRNGMLVWRGPIVGWRVDDDGRVEISALDVLALTKKWFIYIDHTFEEVDLWTVLSTLFTDQQTYADWFYLVDPAVSHPGELGGWAITREYRAAQMHSLYQAMRDLATEAGMFFSAGPDKVHYDPNEYDFGSAAPVLHDGSVFNRPKVTVDCTEVGTRVWAVGDDAGVGGFQTILDVSLTTTLGVEPYSEVFVLQALSEPDPRLQGAGLAQAATPYAVEALAPKVTIEAMQLSPSFGGLPSGDNVEGSFSDINDLRPGLLVKWGFDANCMSAIPINTLVDPVAAYPPSTYGDVVLRRYDVWPPPGFLPPDPPEVASVVLSSERIEWAALVQLSVSVSSTDDGVSESISASFIPKARA